MFNLFILLLLFFFLLATELKIETLILFQGMQPHLQALLSLYKFFVPTLISVSLPMRKKVRD